MFIALAVPTTLPSPRSCIAGDLHKHTARGKYNECDYQLHIKKRKNLEGQGRARREAARRRKSEWKVNVAIPNSSRSNGSWQVTPKTVSLSIVKPRGI